MSNVRTYLVIEKTGSDDVPLDPIERLVDQKSAAAALSQVTTPRFEVRLATREDLKRLLPMGIKIEQAD